MQFKSVFLSLLAATGAVAKRSCGTPKPTEEQKLIAQNFQILEAEAIESGNFSIAATISVNVYWHVLATSKTVSGGYLTQATLNKQLAVLNTDYASHGISFTQAGVDWTVNSAYANDQQELAMKKALRKGKYADLNVYFLPGTEYLGYAYFPQAASTGSEAFYLDGVVIQSASVPGGSLAEYNLGKTATHEIGHWLGLYHTFQGGCTGTGDSISDTPAEAEAAYGCLTTRDSCPNQTGKDPVTNYMDYSDDDCMTNFTPGQRTRMTTQWNTFRAGK